MAEENITPVPEHEQDPAKQEDTSDIGKRDGADRDELVEEWGEDSFPASDPPANYLIPTTRTTACRPPHRSAVPALKNRPLHVSPDLRHRRP
ncbi:hypothetical protein QP028_01750 [Corynebacterium suedekumii]|nr:hypothetical protein QP028_01750 [Corynebacterium suedekumii]